MVQYMFYTDKTLHYMEHALYHINQTKGAFRDTRQIIVMIWGVKKRHFNFRKWHIMSYYPELMKRYGSAMGFTTDMGEAMYIT